MVLQRTLVLLKPSAIIRGFVGNIITRLENKGLKIVAIKLISISREKAKLLYASYEGKPIQEHLIAYIMSAPCVLIIVEAEEAIKVVRTMIGCMNPADAQPGTIRGDLALSLPKNIVHASDSVERASNEINLFFQEKDIVMYNLASEEWI